MDEYLAKLGIGEWVRPPRAASNSNLEQKLPDISIYLFSASSCVTEPHILARYTVAQDKDYIFSFYGS